MSKHDEPLYKPKDRGMTAIETLEKWGFITMVCLLLLAFLKHCGAG
jgi:hypothetical protein